MAMCKAYLIILGERIVTFVCLTSRPGVNNGRRVSCQAAPEKLTGLVFEPFNEVS